MFSAKDENGKAQEMQKQIRKPPRPTRVSAITGATPSGKKCERTSRGQIFRYNEFRGKAEEIR